jgi:hypothetical protein
MDNQVHMGHLYFDFFKRVLLFAFLILGICWSGCSDDPELPPEPDIPDISNDIPLLIRSEGANNISFTRDGDSWLITTTGIDPYFWLDANVNVDFKTDYMLAFECYNSSEVLPLVIFVGDVCDNDHLLENGNYFLPYTNSWKSVSYDLSKVKSPPATPFKSVRIRFGLNGHHQFRVRNFVLRAPNEQEKEDAQKEIDKQKEEEEMAARLNAYLSQNFSSSVSSVITDYNAETIQVSGNINTSDMSNVGLAEIPMWLDQTKLTEVAGFELIEENSFARNYSRFAEDGRDRLLSGWAVVKKTDTGYTLLSALHHTDQITNPRSNLPKMIPASLKGIGGCPYDHEDIETLNIATGTFNIILDQILYTSPAAGRIPYEYAGKTWYADVNGGAIQQIDKDVKKAQELDIMLSAILLIPVNRGAETGSWLDRVAHPENELSAAFAMPDMLSKDAVEAYAATMNFLCERYSSEEYGRIHHWIIHNEIQSGFYWTNAGKRKMETYMNLYQRSMRLVQTIARQYDSNAKALISLDHDWARVGSERGYSAVSLLNQLLKYCRQEGDFEWGIAFHPYPEDIFNPKTWLDAHATYSFDTEFITPKNLEVLDAWVEKPEVSFNHTEPREIQFTEQGINTLDYESQSLADQAAGLAYSLAKVQKMRNVTSYAYHLWADAHEEGELRLGLRKYGDDSSDPHGTKPSWEVFKAFNTSQWDEVTKPYLELIGISDWSEIYYRGIIN